MSAKKFEVKVLAVYCKGCGLCVEVCSQGALFITARRNERGVQPAGVVPEANCTGCLNCVAICPDVAIEIHQLVERISGVAYQ